MLLEDVDRLFAKSEQIQRQMSFGGNNEKLGDVEGQFEDVGGNAMTG